MSNNKLYVGNLAYSTSDQDLANIFSQFGEVVSAQVITDKFSGQSKGFAFVEMANADEAKKAIDGVDGSEQGGRTVKVNLAKPKESRNNWRD